MHLSQSDCEQPKLTPDKLIEMALEIVQKLASKNSAVLPHLPWCTTDQADYQSAAG
jgi:hypothetical protein